MWTMPKGRRGWVGQPEDTTELVRRLRTLFSSGGCVERAYLVLLFDPESGEPPHNLIGILMKAGSTKAFDDFHQEMGAVIKQDPGFGEIVDILDMSTGSDLATAVANYKPFYP
jgi:hypothetical protein